MMKLKFSKIKLKCEFIKSKCELFKLKIICINSTLKTLYIHAADAQFYTIIANYAELELCIIIIWVFIHCEGEFAQNLKRTGASRPGGERQ